MIIINECRDYTCTYTNNSSLLPISFYVLYVKFSKAFTSNMNCLKGSWSASKHGVSRGSHFITDTKWALSYDSAVIYNEEWKYMNAWAIIVIVQSFPSLCPCISLTVMKQYELWTVLWHVCILVLWLMMFLYSLFQMLPFLQWKE